MKTLQDVAKSFKKAAGKAIYPGVSYTSYKTGTSKAFKTGNLLSKFVSDPNNNANKIGRKTINGFELVLTVGPQGAEYGTYVHFGTRKMGERPFAELASQDTNFQTELGLYLSETAGDFVEDYIGSMDSEWKKAGFEVS
jgi:hypothetical protein